MARWIAISDEEEELRSLRRRAYCKTLPRLENWMWLQPCGSREPASTKMSLYRSLHLISYCGFGGAVGVGTGASRAVSICQLNFPLVRPGWEGVYLHHTRSGYK